MANRVLIRAISQLPYDTREWTTTMNDILSASESTITNDLSGTIVDGSMQFLQANSVIIVIIPYTI